MKPYVEIAIYRPAKPVQTPRKIVHHVPLVNIFKPQIFPANPVIKLSVEPAKPILQIVKFLAKKIVPAVTIMETVYLVIKDSIFKINLVFPVLSLFVKTVILKNVSNVKDQTEYYPIVNANKDISLITKIFVKVTQISLKFFFFL